MACMRAVASSFYLGWPGKSWKVGSRWLTWQEHTGSGCEAAWAVTTGGEKTDTVCLTGFSHEVPWAFDLPGCLLGTEASQNCSLLWLLHMQLEDCGSVHLACPFELRVSMASMKASGLTAERYLCPVLRWSYWASESKSELTLELSISVEAETETRDMRWPHTCSENVYWTTTFAKHTAVPWKPACCFCCSVTSRTQLFATPHGSPPDLCIHEIS